MSKFTAIPLSPVEQQIISYLKEHKTATAKDIGVALSSVKPLLADSVKGLVQIVDTRKHINPETGEPTRGRPEFVFGLNKRGRDKARRMKVAVAA